MIPQVGQVWLDAIRGENGSFAGTRKVTKVEVDADGKARIYVQDQGARPGFERILTEKQYEQDLDNAPRQLAWLARQQLREAEKQAQAAMEAAFAERQRAALDVAMDGYLDVYLARMKARMVRSVLGGGRAMPLRLIQGNVRKMLGKRCLVPDALVGEQAAETVRRLLGLGWTLGLSPNGRAYRKGSSGVPALYAPDGRIYGIPLTVYEFGQWLQKRVDSAAEARQD